MYWLMAGLLVVGAVCGETVRLMAFVVVLLGATAVAVAACAGRAWGIAVLLPSSLSSSCRSGRLCGRFCVARRVAGSAGEPAVAREARTADSGPSRRKAAVGRMWAYHGSRRRCGIKVSHRR